MQPTDRDSSCVSISSVEVEGEVPAASSSAGAEAEQKSPNDACVICLEPVSERAVAVPCNHCSFDFLCLVSWLQERSKCPLCNAELEAVQYDWRAPNDYKTFAVVSTVTKKNDTPSSSQPRRHPLRQFRRNRPLSHASQLATPGAAISRRRHVYRHQLYSLHVGSNRVSHFKDFTPQTFTNSTDLQSRARKWIRRELQVFDFLNPSTPPSSSSPSPSTEARRANNAEFLLEYIIAILKTVDIKGSTGKAQAMLREFLGEENSNLFWHELGAWLRSPYVELGDWDRHVQYRVKIPDFEEAYRGTSCAREEQRGGVARRCSNAYGSIDSRAAEARQRYQPD